MFLRNLLRVGNSVCKPVHVSSRPQFRSFGLKLTSIRPAVEHEHSADGTCCGHNSESVQAAPVKEEKVVCDPYGQDGKPYDVKTVKREMLGLDDGWVYDEEKKILKKAFSFHKRFMEGEVAAPVKKLLPGEPTGAIYGASACFTFAQYLNNLCTNCDHWFYDMTVTPRKAEVLVQLKTIVRGGLTSNDFYIAMHLDTIKSTRFK